MISAHPDTDLRPRYQKLLADSQDAVAMKGIEDAALGRSYPVEWTRLVALLLFDAQLRMAWSPELADFRSISISVRTKEEHTPLRH